MTGFRELVQLLKNYSADELIKVFDVSALQNLQFFASAAADERSPVLSTRVENLPFQTLEDSNFSKIELRNRLWDTLFFLDVNQDEFEEPNRVAYLCWQRLAVLKTLMGTGAIISLREIAEPLLQTAKKYELTLVVLEAAAHLRQFCALHDGNMESFEVYCRLIAEYEDILKAEQLAEDHYHAFWLQHTEPHSTPGSMAEQAKASVLILQPYAANCHTTAFTLNYQFLQLQAAILEAKWAEVVQICEQASNVLAKKAVVNRSHVSAFLFNQALGLANLGHLEQASKILTKAIAQESTGGINWFMFNELQLKLLLHQGDYIAAWRLFKFLCNHRKNGTWPRERKQVYNAVFLFLSDQQAIRLASRDKGLLLLNHMPAWHDQIPECKSNNLEVEATLLLLQMPKWIRRGESAALTESIQNYLNNSGAFAPHQQRWIALMDALEAIQDGQNQVAALEFCQQKLTKIPLDYAVPETAPEILPIDAILKFALSV